MPSSCRPGTAGRVATGRRTLSTSIAPRLRTTNVSLPSRQSATVITCSTSGAAPVRPPATPPAWPPLDPLSVSTCRRRCSRLPAAERLTRGSRNAQYVQLDAQIHPFETESFDAAISRTGAMFFGDAVAAFTNIGRALRPGGRIALLTWQPVARNEWIREFSVALAAGRGPATPPPNAPGRFSLSEPDRVRTVLGSAGFTDIALDGTSAGMWFGTDADDAYRLVSGLLGWMLEGLDDAGRARGLEALRATISDHETDDGVVYESATWVIRATRP